MFYIKTSPKSIRKEIAMPAIIAPDNTPTAIFHSSVILLSSWVYFSVYTKVLVGNLEFFLMIFK